MNSRVSWSVEGIDPSVREKAEAAARRAGMSLSDWLNSTIGESAPPNLRDSAAPRPILPSQETQDVADIHQRLDSITRQIEQISRPAPRNDAPRNEAPRGEPGVARQLNDAISRLDARLSQISNPAPARQTQLQNAQRQADQGADALIGSLAGALPDELALLNQRALDRYHRYFGDGFTIEHPTGSGSVSSAPRTPAPSASIKT